jgi:hypothetical protein
LIGLVLFSSTTLPSQTNEALLKANFDIVETFDTLQDWIGHGSGDVTSANDMPKRMDGSASIWQYYSLWGSNPQSPWIGNHGQNNILRGGGKSLCLDYDGGDGNQGPSRLGFHIGNSPDTGYKNDVYIFFMNRYSKGFFPLTDSGQFQWFGYFKSFEIATGFRNIWNWGTVAQQNAAYNQVQNRNIYGLNFSVMNFMATNGHLKSQYNIYVANASPSGDIYGNTYSNAANGADLSNMILNGEWFGIEYHFKKSNPAGTANGKVEIWLYGQNGTVVGYDNLSNIVNLKNGSSNFDHAFNKFVWGGSRYENDFGERIDGHATTDQSARVYIDDIIVHGSRIGPSYFSITSSNRPFAPTNLKNN